MALRELHQQPRKEVIAGADHRHVQAPARHALELRHGLLGLLELLDDLAAALEHLRAGRREVDLLAELLEQRQPGVLLQLADLGGDGWLGEVEFLGGARIAAVARDRLEDLELAQGGISHGVAS